jgi:hypothetical protein
MAIWYNMLPFGIFYGYLAYFSRFGMLYQSKSGNRDREDKKTRKMTIVPM